MDDQRTVILCGDNPFFASTLGPIIQDVGWRAIAAVDAEALDAALAGIDAGQTLVAIDLAAATDPSVTLERIGAGGGEGPGAIALRSGDEDAELLAKLKRAGVVWFFDASAAKHEILYALKSLFHPQVSERRRHPRAPTELPVTYWSGNDEHRQGTIRDLSEGGMFIECEERYILGTLIHLQFDPNGTGTIEMKGEVVFTSPRMQRQSALVPGVGVKFGDPDPAAIQVLQDYIERVLKRMPDTYNKRLLGLREDQN